MATHRATKRVAVSLLPFFVKINKNLERIINHRQLYLLYSTKGFFPLQAKAYFIAFIWDFFTTSTSAIIELALAEIGVASAQELFVNLVYYFILLIQ